MSRQGNLVYEFIRKIIPKPVKQLISSIHINSYYKEYYKEPLNDLGRTKHTKRIILMGTPEHGNLGDHAIAEAALKFLGDYYDEYNVIEITGAHYRKHKKPIARRIKRRDIILITGGGFLGSLWPVEEIMVRDIIETFRKNKIIIFPSTIYFEEGADGKAEFAVSKGIYAKHKNLIICLRDAASYDVAKSLVGEGNADKLHFVPDISLYLNKAKYSNLKRDGILLCLREDKEKVISREERSIIKNTALAKGKKIRYTSTMAHRVIKKEERSVELDKKLNEFRKSEIVITDRLHGMIFAAITGTPCIALNNLSGKVKGVYSWIEYLEYITFVKSAEEVENKLDELMEVKNGKFNNDSLIEHFDMSLSEIL